MDLKRLLAVCVLACALHPAPASAVGTFVAAPLRVDMVYDGARDTVYIANGGQVLRYHVASGTFASPITLGGQLSGIDLSADGRTLAVADRTSSETQVWVHRVPLDGAASGKLVADKASYESGTWAVAFAADGSLYSTSRYAGSGWASMRRFDVATGAVSIIAELRQDSMISASGDGQTIAFAESNISDGRWGLYDVPTGGLVRREWYENGTSWFNYEIATDAIGGQFAIPTYGGTYVYDADYARIGIIGTYAGPQPVGVAYHPVEPLLFLPWAGSSEVRVYDARTLTHVDSLDFENSFSHTGNHAFGPGRTRLSRDGSLLMVSVAGGVRVHRLYAPLRAAPVSMRVPRGQGKVWGKLAGSIGNGGKLAYSIVTQPAHGRVAISAGGNVVYVPFGTASGVDSFRYRVHYGLATTEGNVTVQRTPVATVTKSRTR